MFTKHLVWRTAYCICIQVILRVHISAPSLHRITKWLRLEGTPEGHVVQAPCSSKATQSRLPRQLLKISTRRESLQPLRCHCSITHTVKRFLMFRQNFLFLLLICSAQGDYLSYMHYV